MIAPDQIERLLVVVAHPDDVDFGAGGTVAALVGSGVSVSYCIATDGDAGGSDDSISRPEMAARRRVEQTAAGAVLGVSDLEFLGHRDGRLEATLELRREITRAIRRVRPQVVVTQSPEFNLDRIFTSHPDHLAVGRAALAAVYPDARNPYAFPDLRVAGLEPWAVDEVWLMGHPVITDAVDVTATVDQKFAALFHHVTQLPDPVETERRVRQWMAHTAVTHGLPDGCVAEGFRVVRTA